MLTLTHREVYYYLQLFANVVIYLYRELVIGVKY